ncbi:hypothetical protein E3N88_20761 [Mikania micrantha]|uniref:Helitron helicase-like domain-containing protein n=1 Tax=Mikania micrantha TaxID=192012 RepID=A0A5N6NKR0_9ASTR|nr:hypothetical protein E3N88_20761 [Mikania micrantha]
MCRVNNLIIMIIKRYRAPRTFRPTGKSMQLAGSGLKQLFENREFLKNARAYNSLFSVTSFGANVDNLVNQSQGMYVFKVHYYVSHWLGSLCPPEIERPHFMQMYVYDIENEVANRMQFFGAHERVSISHEVVQSLTEVLNQSNELVKLLRTARDLLVTMTGPDFVIRLYNGTTRDSYRVPTQGTLGAIVCDHHTSSRYFDVVIHSKDGTPQTVSKLHPFYMALQYPLLFLFAKRGWSPELRMQLSSSLRGRQHVL